LKPKILINFPEHGRILIAQKPKQIITDITDVIIILNALVGSFTTGVISNPIVSMINCAI
jgi:hypothetical protein